MGHWTGNQSQFGILLRVDLILTVNNTVDLGEKFMTSKFSLKSTLDSTTSIARCRCHKAHGDAQQTFDMGYTRALRLG